MPWGDEMRLANEVSGQKKTSVNEVWLMRVGATAFRWFCCRRRAAGLVHIRCVVPDHLTPGDDDGRFELYVHTAPAKVGFARPMRGHTIARNTSQQQS